MEGVLEDAVAKRLEYASWICFTLSRTTGRLIRGILGLMRSISVYNLLLNK